MYLFFSVGVRISNQQQQHHQQNQAANAAAQNLAGNSGMTVRLMSPTQVSQVCGFKNNLYSLHCFSSISIYFFLN